MFIIAITAIAFNETLRASLRVLSVDSPLAYTGLVPGIALLVALTRPAPVVRSRPTRRDAWTGVACCGVAVAISVFAGTRLGSAAWAWRIDVPALALFVAGAILVCFGRGELRRQRATVLILAIAWPVPWALLFLRVLTPFTAVTVAVVHGGLDVTHWAKPAGGTTTRFLMGGRTPYVIDVAPACSGIDGVVGFVLVSVAFAALITGPKVRKALWLGAALVLLWLLNAVRVLAIFGIAHEWGRHVAIDWVHPYAGIVMFNVAMLVMLLLLGRFGLHLHAPEPPARDGTARWGINVFACTALVALAIVGGIASARLDRFDLVAGEQHTTTRSFVDAATAQLGAVNVHPAGERRDASAFFAEDASWRRYDLVTRVGTVRADVIDSESPSALATFGTLAFVRSPATAVVRVDRVTANGTPAQVWHFANGHTAVAWLTRVRTGAQTVTQQIVLRGGNRGQLLSLAGSLAGAR